MKSGSAALLLAATSVHGGGAPAPVPIAAPFAAESHWAAVMAYPRPGSLHGVGNLDVTDRFITANGLLLDEQGVMLQPTLMLNAPLYADPSRALGAATLSLGGWASWASHEGGTVPANWREVDLFAGLTVAIERRWLFTAFYTTYLSQTDSYPTASDLALGLNCDDSEWLGAAALHPFVELKLQTEGSTTLPYADAAVDEGYMFRAGLVPQRQWGRFKFELPVYFTLVSDGYYQASDAIRSGGYQGGAVSAYGWRPAPGGVGFLSAALKLSTPLDWLSGSAVRASAYAAVQTYHLVNDGLLDTNQALGATVNRRDDLVQFHCGINVAF